MSHRRTSPRLIGAALLVLALTSTLPAQSPPPAARTAPPAGAAATANGPPVDPSEYLIGPEDVLQISIWKNEAMSRTVPVRPDGKVTLPLLNDIVAAGMTPMQFREVLTEKLAEYMPAPEVSVIVVDARSFKVTVMGEVPKPGRYELRSRTTVLDMIALAGGLSNFASRGKIVILRPGPQGQERLPFNYNRALAGEQENFYLRAGDILVVP
jgi:polysaccharide export outer membrane protein